MTQSWWQTIRPPEFQRLTFRRGVVRAARFADDGSVVYGAAWDGGPDRLYVTQPSAVSTTTLDLPPAHVLALSRQGQLAILLQHTFDGWTGIGKMAGTRLAGGEVRPLLADVREADFAPDGETVAVVRRTNGRDQLEWPSGTVVYRTTGFLSSPRISPNGRLVAVADHPIRDRQAGRLIVLDGKGMESTLASNLNGFRGLAWSPAGNEVWFSTRTDEPSSFAVIQSSDLRGRARTIASGVVDLALMDISRAGRALVAGETRVDHIETGVAGSSRSDQALGLGSTADVVSDGGLLLVTQRDGGTVHLVNSMTGESTRVGEGRGVDLSRDGARALIVVAGPPSRAVVVSIRSGVTQELPKPSQLDILTARFFPDGEHVVLIANSAGSGLRGYIEDVATGLLTPFTKAGVRLLPSDAVVVSPDGQRVALTDVDGVVKLFPIDGRPPEKVPTAQAGEFPLGWTSDGRGVLLARGLSSPWQIEQVDLTTAERKPWRVITASQPVGAISERLVLSPSAEAYAHSYSQVLSNLFLVDGLR